MSRSVAPLDIPPPEPSPVVDHADDGRATDLPSPSPEEPEFDAEGLVVMGEPEFVYDDPSEMPIIAQDFDIVVIHGLHGPRRPPWKHHGSGDSSWCASIGSNNGRKVMSFGYKPARVLAGNLTRQAIRKAAESLLKDVKKERHKMREHPNRSIMFITHDIGGIILKDALTVAGLNPREYSDIFDFTRVLIFYGCPHWAADYTDMEDILARFIFYRLDNDTPPIAASVDTIRGLARAIFDVNSLFTDTKHIYRAYVVSVYSGEATSSIYQTFDSYHATMGMPFELRLAGGISPEEDGEVIKKHLERIGPQAMADRRTISHERTLLSIAAPMPSLFTDDCDEHPFAWIRNNNEYQTWLEKAGPQLLYITGRAGVRDAAEYIFYDLNRVHEHNNNQIVLYFTFNRWDMRRDSVQDMLTCFLAQIIGHFPRLAEFVIAQFRRLQLDRSWNSFDLLNWFEYYRLRGEVDGISCVIDHFDDCEPESRKAFLDLFSYLAKTHERPWKVVVTSLVPQSLFRELEGCPVTAVLDLDPPALLRRSSAPKTPQRVRTSPETYQIVKRRPELRDCEDKIEMELSRLDGLVHEVRDLVREHVSAQHDWPQKRTIQDILGPVSDMTPESVITTILANVPDKPYAFRALAWILYTVRPVTIWELATVMLVAPDSHQQHQGHQEDRTFPEREFVDNVRSKVLTWLGGLVIVEQHEYHILSPAARAKLLEGIKQGQYHWNSHTEEVHTSIARTCLQYLGRDRVKDHLTLLYGGDDQRDPMTLPTHCDRRNLCDYASQWWLRHLSLAPDGLQKVDEMYSFLEKPDHVRVWLKAYWAASNPIRRSPRPFPSPYPVLAGPGLADLVDPGQHREEVLSEGLVEACLHGHDTVVHDLLPSIEHSLATLERALVAAGSKGIAEVWMLLIRHIEDRHPGFPWRRCSALLNRATWLGLSEVAEALLKLGCDVDHPEDSVSHATPLLLVARTGHVRVAQLLLNFGADTKRTDNEGRTGLHLAACFGHPRVASLIVQQDPELINLKDHHGLTPVYLACLWGNFTAVRQLCELGADLTIGDRKLKPEQETAEEEGTPALAWYPLGVAAEEGHTVCVEELLKAKADANIEGFGGTPLRHAVAKGLPELCRRLIKHGARPNHASIQPPILHHVVDSRERDGRLQIVQLLVEHGARIDAPDSEGTTPLASTCWSDDPGMLDIAECLLEQGAHVNRADENGMAPLHIAVQAGKEDLVQVLLKHKADANLLTKDGQRPLSYAASSEELTRLLLDHGADPKLHTPGGDVPLVRAMRAEQTEVVRLLLEHGASPEASWGRDSTWRALQAAAAFGMPECIRLLGDAGADFGHRLSSGHTVVHVARDTPALAAVLGFHAADANAQDDDGDAPLHLVTSRTALEQVRMLVGAGADVNLLNKAGLSPLAAAVRSGNAPIVRYLLRRGADIDAASPFYGTPLQIACARLDLDLAESLLAAHAQVDLAVSGPAGPAGTALQAALLAEPPAAPAHLPDDSGRQTKIVELLLAHGADPTSRGGRIGSAVAAAAYKAPLSLLKLLLLTEGADRAVSDGMHRQPVHFAALHGFDHLDAVMDAGGDAAAPDKAGRTALHWAAQGGDIAAVRHVLAESKTPVDEPDEDGWTPLCWALRARWPSAEVVRELIAEGADRTVKTVVGGKEWTPLAIGQYHSVGDEILALLAAQPTKARNPGKRHEENKRELQDLTREIHPDAERRPGLWPGVVCDYCLASIVGDRYICRRCINFSLCFKCRNSGGLDLAEHSFDGPDYRNASSDSETSSLSSADEDSGTKSDDDPDDN